MPSKVQTPLPNLFDHLKIRDMILKNRLVHTPTVTNLGSDGVPTEEQIRHYERIAIGGVGLIITEGMSVHRTSFPNNHIIKLYDGRARDGLLKLAKTIQRHETKVLPQLWHVGRQQLWGPKVAPWGVSQSPDPFSGASPHVMTEREILEIEEAYVKSASMLNELGFDGIELHGAHGYLITQFMSPWTNRRTDKFGGSFENRMRFVTEILEMIRKETGSNFILGLRLDGSEFTDGGITIKDTEKIINYLTLKNLIDLIDVGEGNFSFSLETHVPDMHFPEAPFLDIIKRMKNCSKGIPIIATGRIVSKSTAEKIISSGNADLVGMSRPLISDPDLPSKWEGTNKSNLRKCISCNVCWDNIQKGRKITCIHNPGIFSEAKQSVSSSARKKKINVIGGGPAGMEAAWVAASLGHDVTLWEGSKELGGQIKSLAGMGGLKEYGEIIEYQKKQLSFYSVEVHTNRMVSYHEIDNLEGDLLIIATGSSPMIPEIWIKGTKLMFPSDPQLLTLGKGKDKKALIYDDNGGYYAFGPMELLTELGYSVTVVSTKMELGPRLDFLSRIGLQRRIRERNVNVYLGFFVKRVCTEGAVIQDLFTSREKILEPFDIVVWAAERISNYKQSYENTSQKKNVLVIGDAYSPRDIMSAIFEGQSILVDR